MNEYSLAKVQLSKFIKGEAKMSLFRIIFVTLQEFSAFLCIKEVWGIEGKWGYELATVLNSTFCYKLHQRTPDGKPPAVLWLIIGCKVTNK